MKTKIILLVITTMLSTALFAQQPKDRKPLDPKENAEKMTAMMKDKLLLTPEQEKKVYEINFEFAKKRQDMMKEEGEKANKRADLMKERTEKMNKILTTEQKAKMEQMMERKQNPGNKQGQGKGHGQGQRKGQQRR